MKYKLEDIQVGDTVRVMSNFGRGPVHVGKVTAVEDDIKNGRPGIDYNLTDNGLNHWAYLDQVFEVKKA